MGEFKRLNVKRFEKKTAKTTPDSLYWKKYGANVFLKEFGPIDYIDFSPTAPHYFAVTSSVRVQVYSPITRLLYKNLSRFQKSAYGGAFRSDGKLLCSGGEEGAVKLFDVGTKSLLRVFKGHTGPVHRCFFTADNTRIVSYSDDSSVGVWDIPSEQRLCNFYEHSDYIRAGAVSPVAPNVFISGGYDNVIKLYDTRSESVIFSLKHNAPVESLLFLPSGSVFLSAGGTEIKVWDILAGGRVLSSIHQHHKTVTCLRLASNGCRVLSAALDRHVNVYDVATFSRLHSITYPNSILSLGISANDETLAVGMVDGLVSVSRREEEVSRPKRRQRHLPFHKVLNDGHADLLVGSGFRGKVPQYETHLKRFDFTKALTVVLMPYVTNKMPHITVSVMKELMARKALHLAIGGNEPKTVVPFLRFLIKYIGDSRFSSTLIQVADAFMDVYEDSIGECGATAVQLFKRFYERVKEEVALTEALVSLQGGISLLLSASDISRESPASLSAPAVLKPSDSAQKFIVDVS